MLRTVAIRLPDGIRTRFQSSGLKAASYSTSTIFSRVLDFTNKLNRRLVEKEHTDLTQNVDKKNEREPNQSNHSQKATLELKSIKSAHQKLTKSIVSEQIRPTYTANDLESGKLSSKERTNIRQVEHAEITTVIEAFKGQHNVNSSEYCHLKSGESENKRKGRNEQFNQNKPTEEQIATWNDQTLDKRLDNGKLSNEETLRKRLSVIASVFTSESEFLMQLMLNYPSLLALRKERAQDIIYHLQTISIEKKHICEHPWLFCLKNLCLEEKVWVINTMQEKHSRLVDLHLLIPLLNLTPQSMRLYLSKFMQNKENALSFCLTFQERIQFLCKELEILPHQCHQLFEDHQVILTKPLEELRNLILLIKSEGKVKACDLLRDIWILRHNCDRIRSRIEKANKLSVPFRPWMGRCSEESFQNRCERHVKQRLILNGRTVSEFIAQRLQVSEQDVQRLVIDSEKIESVSVEKLDNVLQSLLDANVDKYFILNNIKMVEFSSPTLLKRISQVRQVFGSDEHLNLIYLDRRNYERRFISLARKYLLYEKASRVLKETA